MRNYSGNFFVFRWLLVSGLFGVTVIPAAGFGVQFGCHTFFGIGVSKKSHAGGHLGNSNPLTNPRSGQAKPIPEQASRVMLVWRSSRYKGPTNKGPVA